MQFSTRPDFNPKGTEVGKKKSEHNSIKLHQFLNLIL